MMIFGCVSALRTSATLGFEDEHHLAHVMCVSVSLCLRVRMGAEGRANTRVCPWNLANAPCLPGLTGTHLLS